MSQDDFSPKINPGEGMPESNIPLFFRGIMEKLKRCNSELKPGAKILEVGAGDGGLVKYMREQGLDAVGIDADPKGPAVLKADITNLPYEPESFDLIISKQVFDGFKYPQHEHVQDEMRAEMVRVLKRGAVYYAYEIFHEPLRGLVAIQDSKGNDTGILFRKF